MPRAKCFTFYSYKGGSGRSTTLINTVRHFMELSGNKPILVVDADLESAGLTYLFDCENRFTHLFEKAIHTERLLTSNINYLNLSADVYFGIEREPLIDCKTIFERNTAICEQLPELPALMEGIKLHRSDLEHLQKIFAAHCNSSAANCDPDSQALAAKYDVFRLFLLLRDIQQGTNAAEVLAKKNAAVENFLPARSFVDISHIFGCPENSVHFLGVDLSYQGEHQVAENSSRRTIANLARACAERGYQAILFDCGSGVQSTAHVLHMVSDVLIYCMRPTQQFIRGTKMQLFNYKGDLDVIASQKNAGQKPVILLPTAVPPEDPHTEQLQNNSFNDIQSITSTYRQFIDPYFCSTAACLREVSLFKWREFILGVNFASGANSEILAPYTSEATMPSDALAAYRTYRALAQRMLENA